MSFKDEEWTMRDGTTIMVEDMSEAHAKNTLRMIIRNVQEAKSRQEYLEAAWEDDFWEQEKYVRLYDRL